MIRGLHFKSGRDKENLFLLEGQNVIEEALASGLQLEDVLIAESAFAEDSWQSWLSSNLFVAGSSLLKKSLNTVEDKVFASLCTTTSPTAIIATAHKWQRRFDELSKASPCRLAILDGIQDPGNLGTIFRSAHAFNIDALICVKGCVDPFSPKVVRAASGALFKLPFCIDIDGVELIRSLKENGFQIVVMDGKAKETISSFRNVPQYAFVLGNEGHGPSTEFLENADRILKIPTRSDCESLNVASAASIVFYEFYRDAAI